MKITTTPEFNLAVFSFLLNFVWEMFQVPFFAGMAGSRHWDSVLFCTRASLGDSAISVAAYWVVSWAAGSRKWMTPKPQPRELLLFIVLGLAVTMVLELIATRVLHRWTYAPSMPLLPFVGVGLTPFLQWLVLPPVILQLACRQMR